MVRRKAGCIVAVKSGSAERIDRSSRGRTGFLFRESSGGCDRMETGSAFGSFRIFERERGGEERSFESARDKNSETKTGEESGESDADESRWIGSFFVDFSAVAGGSALSGGGRSVETG